MYKDFAFLKMSIQRGVTWSDMETHCLISIWQEEQIECMLAGLHRNQHVYEIMSEQMKAKGYHRSWSQCRTKLKSLKNDYHFIKDGNRKSGRERQTSIFFEELDAILGCKPATQPAKKIETSLLCDPIGDGDEINLTQDCGNADSAQDEARETPSPDFSTLPVNNTRKGNGRDVLPDLDEDITEGHGSQDMFQDMDASQNSTSTQHSSEEKRTQQAGELRNFYLKI